MMKSPRQTRALIIVNCRKLFLIALVVSTCGCLHGRPPNSGTWPETHTYCRNLDDRVTAKRAEHQARRALRRCGCDHSRDYKSGFVQAWVDVALGGSGEVPPVPPEHYWSVCRRDPSGHRKAQQWFAGYAAGACRALGRPQHPYNEIPASGALQAACNSRPGGW